MNPVPQKPGSRDDVSAFSEGTIISRFDRQVAAFPDNLAVVTDDGSLTYRALDLRASGIAVKLASLPSAPSRPIALFMKDEVGRIAAMLGALKANRIFIALAPNSPRKWIEQVILDSDAAQIIVDKFTRSVVPSTVTVMGVDEFAPSSERFVTNRTGSADDIAYISYTSGSTGRPKGVASSHRRLVRASDVRNRVAGVNPSDRYANLRSSGVSSWIRNSLSPLFSGACLYPFNVHEQGLQRLAAWLVAQKITYVSLSSPLLRTWLALLPDDIRFPALRFVGTTDERLYAEDVIGLSRHLEGDWRIGHSYASAECGTIAAQTFTPSRLPDGGIVAAGSPVDGMEVWIKDERGEPARPGEIGEIAVRSRFLAQGYWNNQELTAKVFETDPSDGAVRVYSTSDLGRWRTDGTLEITGRKGRQIKLRGFNIEPFQVENALTSQPDVTDAVVLLYDGVAGQEPSLVAYVIAPATASPSAMRKRLAERLPSHMVPSHIVIRESFPIASSGKIDRTALPSPNQEQTRGVAFRAPSNDRQHALLTIWQEVLKIPSIGIDDDFFELGGTSLQALIVFAKIETELSFSLSPTTIVQAPTIARLAEFIQARTGLAAHQTLVPLRTSGTASPLFLVHNKYCFVMYYRHLLRDLKSDRPVFGIQPPPLDGKHRVARTVETMAADYVTEIRRVQPHGPYFIAGHSFGGLVSFEVAQQLIREGERVDFLGLMDTGLRNVSAELGSQTKKRLGRNIYDFFAKSRWIIHSISKRTYNLGLKLGHPIPHERRPAHYDWFCVKASSKYVAGPYAGHITLFASAGNSERQRERWGLVARGGLTVIEVPATHDDIVLPPYSRLLARHFDDCLEKASAE